MNDDKSYILKTLLITTGIFLGLAVVSFCVLIFCFPVKSAEILYEIGYKDYASNLYYNEYKEENDITFLHKSLSIQIELNNYNKIIDYSDEFFNNTNYYSFINQLNNKNLNTSFNLYTKSKLINEDNYYKNYYIRALINLKRYDEAKEFAKTSFDCNNIELTNLKVYVFSNLIGNVEYSYFDEKIGNDKIYLLINDYFTSLNSILDSELLKIKDENEIYYYAVCSKILQVGNDLLQISNNMNTTLNRTEIEQNISKTTNFLNTLIGENNV